MAMLLTTFYIMKGKKFVQKLNKIVVKIHVVNESLLLCLKIELYIEIKF